MTRLTALFAVLLVLSGLSLVSSQYRARQLFIDLDRARNAARKFDIEWRTLQLDQTNYSKHSLIEAAAERDLKMLRPDQRRIQYITLPEHAAGNRDLQGATRLDSPRPTP
ncbi:MAG: cell division protein FtsL [Burkholderiaceae bacterium]